MTNQAAIQAFYTPQNTPALPRLGHAQGPYLFDTSGKRYIDAASGPVVTNIGHGNRHVVDAMIRQAEACTFASRTAFVNDANEALASKLATLCGDGLERAFLTSGGSEAVEAALKFARQWVYLRGEDARWKVLSRNPSYHGSTLGALSVTGDEEAEEVFGPMMARMPKVPAPFTYRVPEGHTPETWAMAAAQALEDTILREGPNTCLAFIMEPVGGLATGALVAHDIYYGAVRDICTRHGLLLVYDEIMSGAGRTGTFLSADHWSSAQPDLVVLAKGLGAGYTPLGAMMAPAGMAEDVARAGGFLHGHTYVANPLSCATGVAVLEEVERLDLIANAKTMGPVLATALQTVMHTSEIVGDVRGKGLLMAIELVVDKTTRQPFPLEANITQRVSRHGMDNGLIVYARRTSRGQFGEWVMICPPLTATPDVIGEIADALTRTLSECVDGLAKDGFMDRPRQTSTEAVPAS